MEFYGSEAIRLGQYCCRRSIKPILPDIIGQYLLYYMSNVYGSSTLVYGYIYCYILLNVLLANIPCSTVWGMVLIQCILYCDIIL